MKSFKQFLKGKVAAVTVSALPVHGSHAHKKKEKAKEKPLKESHLASINQEEHQKKHLPIDHEEYLNKHSMSDHEYDHLNKGYRPRKVEIEHRHGHDDWGFNKEKPVTHEIREYTDGSAHVNRNLVHHATGKASLLHTHAKYKKLLKSENPDAIGNSKETHNRRHEELKTKIKRLDHAFKKSKLKHAATVMSGVGFDPDHYASQHPDRHIHMPAYTSTSSKAIVATKFAKGASQLHSDHNGAETRHAHVLRIHLPKGHSAVPVLSRSSLNNEHETILPRNMKLKISHKPYHTEEHRDEGYHGPITHKYHYWDAHPVEDK